MNNRVLFIFIYFIFRVSILTSQNLQIEVNKENKIFKVGDPIDIVYKLKYDKGILFLFNAIKSNNNNLELISTSDTTVLENKYQIRSLKYTFMGFDSLDTYIPPIIITQYDKASGYRKMHTADSILIQVRTVLVDSTQDIKDIKESKKIPYDWTNFIFTSVIIIIVLFAIYLLIKYYLKRKKLREIVNAKLPHEIALDNLDELERKDLVSKNLIYQYHSEITEIIRNYLETRFLIPALENTTTEIIGQIEKHSEAKEIIELITQFLELADLVKFAKYNPDVKLNYEMMKIARNIVNNTIPIIKTEDNKK